MVSHFIVTILIPARRVWVLAVCFFAFFLCGVVLFLSSFSQRAASVGLPGAGIRSPAGNLIERGSISGVKKAEISATSRIAPITLKNTHRFAENNWAMQCLFRIVVFFKRWEFLEKNAFVKTIRIHVKMNKVLIFYGILVCTHHSRKVLYSKLFCFNWELQSNLQLVWRNNASQTCFVLCWMKINNQTWVMLMNILIFSLVFTL